MTLNRKCCKPRNIANLTKKQYIIKFSTVQSIITRVFAKFKISNFAKHSINIAKQQYMSCGQT